MNAPTLIVGLGGKGSDIILRVSKLVSDEERKQIEFVAFDTDVNELRRIKLENPFVRTVQTSTSLTVGEYLDTDTNARDNWFPVNRILNNKALSEGAGQVRAISRLAFETAARSGKLEELDKAIENLYKLEGTEYKQALRVIVVSSLAGGTGSGLILPVGLYIKNFLSTRFRQSASISRGFFILPEVFYGVIPGQVERNNLKSNAYAALREIDAFMMKGDASLPKKYADSVIYRFPQVASEEYENYDVRPYDYCFLFDAQNVDGKKLNSFTDYLDHAANCIYAQSIGPMNKRSNSSEDNTIRALAKEGGRNRYAGAGTSILKYPFEDVKEYVALNWAKESISEQWMQFDRLFKEQKEENERRRKEGIMTKEIKMSDCYITSVIQASNNKEPFAMQIVNSCSEYDEDGNKIPDYYKWDEYLNCIDKKIRQESSEGQTKLDVAKLAVTDALKGISPEYNDSEDIWNSFIETYNKLGVYRKAVKQYTELTSSMIAYTIFKPGKGNKGADYRIENYLQDSDKKFIHPNAIRFFLYNAYNSIKTKLDMINAKVEKEEKFFDEFDKNYLDDKSTTEREETIFDVAETKKMTLFEKIKRKSALGDGQTKLKNGFLDYLKNINAYREDAMLKEVLIQGLRDVQALSDAFENFFTIFDSSVVNVENNIRILAKKYRDNKGKAARYVCASEKCLERILKEAPYLGSSIAIDGKLSNKIFDMVQDYALMPSKPKSEKYFNIVFDNILDYFRDQVVRTRSNEVDMDIITAIEKEGMYELDNFEDEEKEIYVKSVIDECKVLSSPFIEKPLGEEKQPIHSCAYYKHLDPGGDSPRSDLIKSELKNYGGEADEDISKNMIFFYNSFYGLRANDLSKFAPGKVTETFTRMPGDYYKAYYELVSKLNPSTTESKAITPHIDKWWHIVTKMPDLDEESQLEQETNIYKAFFYGLLNKDFRRIETDNLGTIEYIIDSDILDDITVESRRLVVSNGTPCDTLYEVLDSLAIYPMLVKNILAKAEEKIKNELDKNIKFENGSMMNNILNFRLEEYPLTDGKATRSIFDLPILFKKSITRELYFEEKVRKILEVEFDVIKSCIYKFCDGRQQIEEEKKIIITQFNKFIADMMEEYKENDRVFKEAIFSLTCDMIEKELRNITMDEEANYVAEKAAELVHYKAETVEVEAVVEETEESSENVETSEATDTADKTVEKVEEAVETTTEASSDDAESNTKKK